MYTYIYLYISTHMQSLCGEYIYMPYISELLGTHIRIQGRYTSGYLPVFLNRIYLYILYFRKHNEDL